jgi:hypothetical protein
MVLTISNGLLTTNGYVNGLVTHTHNAKKPHVDGFSTRAIHVGSEPDESTGAVIPALSLSTTFKQNGVGNHKVRINQSNQIVCPVLLKIYISIFIGLRIFSLRQPKP